MFDSERILLALGDLANPSLTTLASGLYPMVLGPVLPFSWVLNSATFLSESIPLRNIDSILLLASWFFKLRS